MTADAALLLLFLGVGIFLVGCWRLLDKQPPALSPEEIDKELEKIEKAAREWGRDASAETVAKARAALKKIVEKK